MLSMLSSGNLQCGGREWGECMGPSLSAAHIVSLPHLGHTQNTLSCFREGKDLWIDGVEKASTSVIDKSEGFIDTLGAR